MNRITSRVEVKHAFETLKILIDGLPFVVIKRRELVGFQSWKEDGKYWIEFTTTSNSMLTEYDNTSLWGEVLRKLDAEYIF